MAAGVEGVGKDTDGTEFEPPDDLAGEMAAESSRAKPGRLGDIPEHGLMSEIEVITDGGRRRYWPAEKQVRIAGETLGGESISSVARWCGVAPELRKMRAAARVCRAGQGASGPPAAR